MLRNQDFTQAMVESLGQDISENPTHNVEKWREIKMLRPGFANFVERRLEQLFDGDEQIMRKSLAFVVELTSLEDKINFATEMAELELTQGI